MDKQSVSTKWTIALIVLGVILLLFFGFRAARSLMRVPPPGRGELPPEAEALRGWMTIDYIAETYDVPAEFIFEQLRIPMDGNSAKSLSDLNREYFSSDEGRILKMVSKAIMDFRNPHKPKDKPRDPKPPEKKP
jgi:hypothetical protein